MSRRSRSLRGALGALLFAAAVIGLSISLLHRHGRRRPAAAPARFAGARTMLNLASYVPEPRLQQPLAIAILRDSASDRYYDNRAVLDSVVGVWRDALMKLGADVRVVTPAEALTATDVRAFVVPASPCLGATSRHALALATERGQGVVATWLTGIRDGGCRMVGYALLTQLAGAARADTLEERSQNYVTFVRGGPLGLGIPPGARMEVAAGNSVAVRAPTREGFYSDFALNPDPAQGQALLDGAVSQSLVGRARTVYWGFDLHRVIRRPWDEEIALRLVRNSVLWAAGVPQVGVLPWPDGAAAAAVIAQDVEEQFGNARYAVDSLRAAGFPGTYFLVSSLALRDRDLVRAMAAQGEIGTHTPQHQLLGGEAPTVQRAAVDQTQRDLRSLLGHNVSGLRPPEEQFDAATFESWAAAGGTYVFGSDNARTASPEIMSVDGHNLVLLGRVINDDFITVAKARRTNVNDLADEYLRAFEKVRALGGLYMLSYHSQLMSRPELVPALARVARHLAADSAIWRATAGQVADWWLRRSLVHARATYVDPLHVEVAVTNDGAQPLPHADVQLLIGAAKPLSATGGARLLGADPYSVELALPAIPPRATITSTVTLTEPVRVSAPRLGEPGEAAYALAR